MSDTNTIVVDAESAGIPHAPGTRVKSVTVIHPTSGEESVVFVPVDHDGSAIKIEFPDGTSSKIEGFDPAEQAQLATRVVVPCGSCGLPQPLTGDSFACPACGAQNTVQAKVSGDAGLAASGEG